ncbi:MAG: SAM-dependent methyltransferase, partial [Paracoccaceae bacterium]
MTALADILIRRIAATGPITIADYMAECLLHPKHGYYTSRDPFGSAGDFTTAPEISQMFGELLGLALAQSWLGQGAPSAFTLAELGPGRGTLMADILRATRRIPGFQTAASVHLVEASEVLRTRQRETLKGHEVTWHRTVDTLPNQPLYLVANEFFDALPIRQFTRDPKGWCERHVGATGNRLAFGLSAPAPIAVLDHRLGDTKPGDVVETRPAAAPIIAHIAKHISAQGGTALIADYGDWRSLGDTLQAVRNHKTDDPLAHPGKADLTSHVDFEALTNAAAGAAVTPLTPQGIVLERLGITSRAQRLALSLTGDALQSHVAAHRRLTHPAEMGTLFKMIAFHHPGSPPPAGFAP